MHLAAENKINNEVIEYILNKSDENPIKNIFEILFGIYNGMDENFIKTDMVHELYLKFLTNEQIYFFGNQIYTYNLDSKDIF